ncbi:UNVERIFIED_ORG: DUF2971 family protein [Serratia quinivorans]
MDDIKLFKFRACENNNLDALKNGYLWFSNLSSLNDPYEGLLSFDKNGLTQELRLKFLKEILAVEYNDRVIAEKKALEAYLLYRMNNKFEDYFDDLGLKSFKNFYDDEKEKTFICSLSLERDKHSFSAPLNNMMMWAHYTNGFKGYCIEFNAKKLIDTIKLLNGKIGHSKMHYPDNNQLPSIKLKTFYESHLLDPMACSQEILKAFCSKHISWSYENEFRLFSESGGKVHYDNSCINSIYIAENMSKENKIKVINIAKEIGANSIYNIELDKSKYGFFFRPLINTDNE